jgi:antitoxin (DNA-binding transcriptional repressor) of toxin-antitoxin stability system
MQGFEMHADFEILLESEKLYNLGSLVILNISELLHSHKKAEQLVRAGERVRVVRHGRNLFDLVPIEEPKPTPGIDLGKLDRLMTRMGRQAGGRNLVSEMRKEHAR